MLHPSQKQFELRNGKVFGGGVLLACVPLISKTTEALRADAEETCAAGPDLLEWRSDFMEELADPKAMAEAAKVLRETAGDIPVVFTPRDPAEGGQQQLTAEQKKDVIRAVCETGCIDLVDLELCFPDDYIQEIREIVHKNGVKLILSNHNFSCLPPLEEVEEKLKRAEAVGADVNKLAYKPQNFHEVAAFCKMICDAKATWMKNPVINSLMGDVGAVTRFGGGSLGSDMCFVSVTGISGPGQMHIDDYRILNQLIDRP